MTDFTEQQLTGVREANALYQKGIEARRKADSSGGKATDAEYGIVVSVVGGGRFQELSLGQNALRLSPSALAAKILACARKAEVSYGKALEGALEESYRGDSFGRGLIAELHQRYPELDEDEDVFEPSPQGRSKMAGWEQEAVHRIDEDDDDDDRWRGPITRS